MSHILCPPPPAPWPPGRYHHEFVKYCNRMDEVWVPSEFGYKVLKTSGEAGGRVCAWYYVLCPSAPPMLLLQPLFRVQV